MAPAKKLPLSAGGLDKKHDLPLQAQPWELRSAARLCRMVMKRKIILVILVAGLVYFFVKNLPADVPSVGVRMDSRTGRSQGRPAPEYKHDPSDSLVDSARPQRVFYDGPVRFYRLSNSLRWYAGNAASNLDHVVFILHDIQSAAMIIPMACEMASFNSSRVHIALITEHESSIQDIITLSGIRQTSCVVQWHDARPDYNGQSTPARQELVIRSALGHISAYLKPKAFVLNDAQAQNKILFSTLRDKVSELQSSLVTIPNAAASRMNWLAGVSADGLAALNNIQIDIVIQPTTDSTGGLIRLLNSIMNADYVGLPLPRVIVDMPQDPPPAMQSFLEHLQWPPGARAGDNRLILFRRTKASSIPNDIVSRSLELFYPAPWPLSQILVVDTDVELSPYFYQYLMYMLLAYKYGSVKQTISQNMVGISLDLPTDLPSAAPLLLSQRSSTKAALFFGDRWRELREWTSLRLLADPDLAQIIGNMTQLDELINLRGYFMLYPTFASDENLSLCTVHTEVVTETEESAKQYTESVSPARALRADTVLTSWEEVQLQKDHVRTFQRILPSKFLDNANFKSSTTLPAGSDIPMFDASNVRISLTDTQKLAKAFRDRVSLEFGSCSNLNHRDEQKLGTLGYLFCE